MKYRRRAFLMGLTAQDAALLMGAYAQGSAWVKKLDGAVHG
jgi:hypothetical protein